MESWKERGVPLHVALRGIEHAFDSHEAKKHKRSVKTLLYCEEEVEAQYAEWRGKRGGGHEEEKKEEKEEAGPAKPPPRQADLVNFGGSLCSIEQKRETNS